MKKYQPINCDLHSYLEHFACLQEQVVIQYALPNNEIKTLASRIRDIFTKESEEFICLENQTKIRLDQILKINDIDFSGQETCTC